MSGKNLDLAYKALEQFEKEGASNPREGERLVTEVLRACGQEVTETGFIGGRQEIDAFFRTKIEGVSQLIGVEIKSGKNPTNEESVTKASHLRDEGRFDRMMIISRAGFRQSAIDLADAVGLGTIDLLSPDTLRNWIKKQINRSTERTGIEGDDLIRVAMQSYAIAIANDPERLWRAEWRDLERVLGEAFEGLGFDTKVTSPAKDGGFDIELSHLVDGKRHIYLVEVKHWANPSKPGSKHLKKLIRVTASRKATAGLLLSSSGFTETVYSGITEYTAPVRLGDGNKIISICKAYQKLKSDLWLPADDLYSTLFSDTRALGES